MTITQLNHSMFHTVPWDKTKPSLKKKEIENMSNTFLFA